MVFSDIIILKYNEKDNSEFIQSLIPNEIYADTRYLCSTQAIQRVLDMNEILKKENKNMKRILRHQVYGLMVEDKKLDDYINTKDGIIIVLSIDDLHDKTKRRINNIIKNNPNKPMLFIFDNINKNMINDTDSYIKDFISNNRKAFFYGDKYINKNDAIIWFKNIIDKQEKINKPNNYHGDEELLSLFRLAQLPMNEWNHENRLRIVYLHLIRFGYANSIKIDGELCKNWINYKTTIGHSELWNYTITRFFIEFIYKIINNDKSMNNFNDIWYCKKYEFLKNGKLFLDYYSRERLFSENAKNNFVEPDLKNI